MAGIGLFLVFLGYTAIYWAWNALQGKSQDTFASYLFPFIPAKSKVQTLDQSATATPPGVAGPVSPGGKAPGPPPKKPNPGITV